MLSFLKTKTRKILFFGIIGFLVVGGASIVTVRILDKDDEQEQNVPNDEEHKPNVPIQITTEMFTAPQALSNLHFNGGKQEVISAGQTEYGTFMYKLGEEDWNSTTPLSDKIGSLSVQWYIVGNDGYLDYGSEEKPYSIDLTIQKGNLRDDQIVAPVANNNFDDPAALIAGECPFGTFMYSLDGVNFSEKIPELTKVGNYTAYWYIEGDDFMNSYAKDAPKTVSINYAKSKLIEGFDFFAPQSTFLKTSNKAIVPFYTGYMYADEEGLKFQYSTNGTKWDDELSELIYTAGEYTLYWYIIGGENYFDFGSKEQPYSVTATISDNMLVEGKQLTKPCGAFINVYTGNDITLLEEPFLDVEEGEAGEFYYSLDGVNYSKTIPSVTNVGKYRVYWYITAGTRYDAYGSVANPCYTDAEIKHAEPVQADCLNTNAEPQVLLKEGGKCGDYGVFYYKDMVSGEFSEELPTAIISSTDYLLELEYYIKGNGQNPDIGSATDPFYLDIWVNE